MGNQDCRPSTKQLGRSAHHEGENTLVSIKSMETPPLMLLMMIIHRCVWHTLTSQTLECHLDCSFATSQIVNELFLLCDTMAAATPFSTPFLQCPCEPALPFDTWLKIFQNYLQVIATSSNECSDSLKRPLLLHCLGNQRTETFLYSTRSRSDIG